jgi:hypothetical protein
MSDIAIWDDGKDGDDENDEKTEQGNLSENDNPSWVMGTISKMVQLHMERFRLKQMKLDQLTHAECGN